MSTNLNEKIQTQIRDSSKLGVYYKNNNSNSKVTKIKNLCEYKNVLKMDNLNVRFVVRKVFV